MGIDKHEEAKRHERRAGGSKPAALPSEGYLSKQRAVRTRNRGNGDVVSWGDLDSSKIIALIDRAVSKGCTITFARTRDGSCLKCSFYDGVERVDEYCRSTEDSDIYVAMLTEMFADGG